MLAVNFSDTVDCQQKAKSQITSFLLNIAEYENFSANKCENANFVGIFIFVDRENFMLS